VKKLSIKTRFRSVLRELKNRFNFTRKALKKKNKKQNEKQEKRNNKQKNKHVKVSNKPLWLEANNWVDNEIDPVLGITFLNRKNKRSRKISNKKKQHDVVLNLPSQMNFSSDNEKTIVVLSAIRKLVSVLSFYKGRTIPRKAYRLTSVNFDGLKEISTSTALVLTAEISKWDSTIRKNLQPRVENWDSKIYSQLSQLGFFDLFLNKPERPPNSNDVETNMSFVPYMRAISNDKRAATENKKTLKLNILELVDRDSIDKWTILHSALTEAITNVTHHAYDDSFKQDSKCWYLTGSFNRTTKVMKIAFYDQGLGIPATLPASKIWEKVVDYFAKSDKPKLERYQDAQLLEAAMKINRTSTDKNDRGKGLQDLLEFIRETGCGYLNILSLHGSYLCNISDGKESTKVQTLKKSLPGTLIMWSVTLK